MSEVLSLTRHHYQYHQPQFHQYQQDHRHSGILSQMGSLSSPTSHSPAMSATTTLQPTWRGYVADTWDALILFEAAISGHLNRVVRRPHDRERSALIRSGSVFIYEESASGIKRWTDGVPWSPSRILNNFLIYRELERPFPPGEKKRAAKKPPKSPPGANEPYARTESSEDATGTMSPATSIAGNTAQSTPVNTPVLKPESNSEREAERSLVGSLTDSYAFKDGGLVKKTMSVNVEGVHYHLVSYYNPEDVKAGLLQKPRDTELRFVQVRAELIQRQNFRAPIDDVDENSTNNAYTSGPDRLQSSYVTTNAGHSSYLGGHAYIQHQMPAGTAQYFSNQQSSMPYQATTQQQHYQGSTQHQLPQHNPYDRNLQMQHPHQQQQHHHHHHQQQQQHHQQQQHQSSSHYPSYYQNVQQNAVQQPSMQIKTETSDYPQYQDQRTYNQSPHEYSNQSGWSAQ